MEYNQQRNYLAKDSLIVPIAQWVNYLCGRIFKAYFTFF